MCVLELQTFSKLASERVPSECRHCRLTSDIFIKEFFTGRQPRYIADIYLETPKTWGSFMHTSLWYLIIYCKCPQLKGTKKGAKYKNQHH